MDFASEKEKKFACPNALEFAITTMMSHNDNQDTEETLKAQSKVVGANETVHYSAMTIQSRKKQNTHMSHGSKALNG